jgi:hypothetical protein
MTLEESIDIADSMKARGFNKDRTVYSKYRFSSRDFIVLMIIIITSVGVIVAKAMGLFSFIYEPVIIAEKIPLWAIFSYVILSLLPSIIDFVEDMRWSYLKQKI